MDVVQSKAGQGRVADAPSGHWVYRLLPRPVWPYAQLARWDRPIGWVLLLWPCWWSVALAASAFPRESESIWSLLPSPWVLLLFLIGAVAMRGAGCTYNDLVDQDIDAQVERTRSRPLPSGQVTRRQAWAFLVAQALAGLMEGSEIRASHREGDERVQDPYCLRCQPQVMGACLDLIRQAAATLAIEANGAPVVVSYSQASNNYLVGSVTISRATLISQAQAGTLMVTLTAHLRSDVDELNPQPLLAPVGANCGSSGPTGDPGLPSGTSFTVEGKYVLASDRTIFGGHVRGPR